jgi:hypothetical protein
MGAAAKIENMSSDTAGGSYLNSLSRALIDVIAYINVVCFFRYRDVCPAIAILPVQHRWSEGDVALSICRDVVVSLTSKVAARGVMDLQLWVTFTCSPGRCIKLASARSN